MSLNGALQIGRTALATSQAAMQVAGNNMANAATEGFHRRSVHLSPLSGEVVGRNAFVGRGVQLLAIRREVDTALQARYRDAISEQSAAQIDQRFLSSIETLQNELTDNDLSSLLSSFFNSFSELANNPLDNAVRSVVVQQGESVAGRLADLRRDFGTLQREADRQLGVTVDRVNDLLDQIADISGQIAETEGGTGEASALRDQRDILIDELAEHMDVTVLEHGSGQTDILVNSIPVLLAGRSRGVELRTESIAGQSEVSVRVAEDGTFLEVDSGTIGGLIRQRGESVTPSLQAIDDLAGQLIEQVNRLHAQGQGEKGFTSVAGTTQLGDVAANLNAGAANLPFRVDNGSFFINVTHQATGQSTSFEIAVDGNAISLTDLVNEINAVVGVPNVTAGISAEKAFTLTADAGFEISFSEDTSGALAALGVNTFFEGRGASTITVNQRLLDDPSMLAAGLGHLPGSNGTALAIADLQDVELQGLNGQSLRGFWQRSVNDLAVRTSAAVGAAQSAGLVRESLSTQLQAGSGVSLDEESINLIMYQRQFQAAARYITAIDEALQILIGLA